MVQRDLNEIREDTIRKALIVLRAKSDTNPRGAISLLIALRDRVSHLPAVHALPQRWDQPRLNVRQALGQTSGAAFSLLEEDFVDLVKRAEQKKIPMDVTDFWEKAALKL